MDIDKLIGEFIEQHQHSNMQYHRGAKDFAAFVMERSKEKPHATKKGTKPGDDQQQHQGDDASRSPAGPSRGSRHARSRKAMDEEKQGNEAT